MAIVGMRGDATLAAVAGATASDGSAGATSGRPRALRAATIVLVVAVAVFYAWTASVTTADVDDLQYYDRLADAFVHGRLDLRPAPPAGLLALPNPYDPGASQPYRDMGFHDLVLYKGRFYTTWGPTPAVVLFAPLRVVGIDMSHAIAGFLFALAAWLFAWATLAAIRRRWFPGTSPWLVVVGGAVLAFGDLAPFLLRRTLIYEVVILSGLCFAMAAVYFLLTGVARQRPSFARLGLGSLSLGLAAGSRPQLAVGVVVLLAMTVHLRREGRLGRAAVLALWGPVCACGCLLLAYNAARFGSPLSVGNTYQLSALDASKLDWGSLSYVGTGLFSYLLSPPTLAHFSPFDGPYTFLVPRLYPGSLPATVPNPAAPTGGMLLCAPVVLLSALMLPARARAGAAQGSARIVGLLVVGGVFSMVFVSYLIFAVERYAGDFTAFFVLAGLIAWVAAADRFRQDRRSRLVLHGVGAVLAIWTIAAGVLMSAPATIGH
jgi:hypothetical protein